MTAYSRSLSGLDWKRTDEEIRRQLIEVGRSLLPHCNPVDALLSLGSLDAIRNQVEAVSGYHQQEIRRTKDFLQQRVSNDVADEGDHAEREQTQVDPFLDILFFRKRIRDRHVVSHHEQPVEKAIRG